MAFRPFSQVMARSGPPGAQVIGKARLETGVLIWFGAVLPGPARLVRTLDDASARDLRAGAAQYAANGRRFAKGLVAIE